MKIKAIKTNKTRFLPLLALADAPRFIADYLEKGRLYVAYEGAEAVAACLISTNNEIQNFAVAENRQGQGLGHVFLREICQRYAGQTLNVGTDIYTATFYEKCGFRIYKQVKNYFPEKYGEPVFDKGHALIDRVDLRRKC